MNAELSTKQYTYYRVATIFLLASSFFYFQKEEINKYSFGNLDIKQTIKINTKSYLQPFITSKLFIIYLIDLLIKISIYKYIKQKYATSVKNDLSLIILSDVIILIFTPFQNIFSTFINTISIGVIFAFLLNIASCFNRSNQTRLQLSTFYIALITIFKCYIFLPHENKYSIFLSIDFFIEMASFYDICKFKFMYIVIFIGQIFLYLLSMNHNYSIVSISTISFIATLIFCYDLISNNLAKQLKRHVTFVAVFIVFKFFSFIAFDFNMITFCFLTVGFVVELLIFFFDLRILGGYFIFVCAFDISLYLLYINRKVGIFVSSTFIFITVMTFFILSRLQLIFSRSEFMEYSNHTYLQQNMMSISAVIKYILLIVQIF